MSELKPIAYAIYGIGCGKHYLKDVKPIPADDVTEEWRGDDDFLGDYWAGNEPLFLASTQPEATKPAQDLSAAILRLQFQDSESDYKDGYNRAIRAAAALASPADALVAGDRVDAERTGTLYQAVQRAAAELPEGWTICLEIERDAGTVELIDPEGERKLIDGNDGYLCQAVNAATDTAIQAQKDGHG